MSPPRLLDAQLLHALEERWRTRGAETPDRMAPGLSDEEIDRIAAPLGFALPEEIRTLYRWHDGSQRYVMTWARGMISLQVVVAEAATMPPWDEERRPTWLRILDERPYLVADCAVGLHDPVPIWNYGPDWGPATRPVFASVGDMVALWIDLIDNDLMYWDGTIWQVRDATPEDVLERLTGVPQS
jgi:hypothetical protein